MKNMAIADTGPLFAFFDKSDKHHQKSLFYLEAHRKNNRGRLISTWPVLTEVSYLLAGNVHLSAQLDFLGWVSRGYLEIFNIDNEHLQRIIKLQEKYSSLPMDLADATLVVCAESLGINKVFSLDKDFLLYRIYGHRHFENLMR